MKKIYKVLLGLFGIEWIYVIVLSEANVQITSFLGKTVGIILFFAPIVVLLYLTSKDEEISAGKRKMAKLFLVFWIFCFSAGMIIEAIELIIAL